MKGKIDLYKYGWMESRPTKLRVNDGCDMLLVYLTADTFFTAVITTKDGLITKWAVIKIDSSRLGRTRDIKIDSREDKRESG